MMFIIRQKTMEISRTMIMMFIIRQRTIEITRTMVMTFTIGQKTIEITRTMIMIMTTIASDEMMMTLFILARIPSITSV